MEPLPPAPPNILAAVFEGMIAESKWFSLENHLDVFGAGGFYTPSYASFRPPADAIGPNKVVEGEMQVFHVTFSPFLPVLALQLSFDWTPQSSGEVMSGPCPP